MDVFLQAAIEEAKKGLAAGGVPIGSVLVIDGQIVGRGHNQRVQKGQCGITRRNGLFGKFRTTQSVRLSSSNPVLDLVALRYVQRRGSALWNCKSGYRREPDIYGA